MKSSKQTLVSMNSSGSYFSSAKPLESSIPSGTSPDSKDIMYFDPNSNPGAIYLIKTASCGRSEEINMPAITSAQDNILIWGGLTLPVKDFTIIDGVNRMEAHKRITKPQPSLNEILHPFKNPLAHSGGKVGVVASIMKTGGKSNQRHKRLGAHITKHPRNQRKGR